MRRATYRVLLALHPTAFRRQFGGEMLWVFDEAQRDRETSGFCFDVARSLLRHWLREADCCGRSLERLPVAYS